MKTFKPFEVSNSFESLRRGSGGFHLGWARAYEPPEFAESCQPELRL